MKTTVTIRAGNYKAELDLCLLEKLPIANIQKLFRLMFSEPVQNKDAIHKIGRQLEQSVTEAERRCNRCRKQLDLFLKLRNE